MNLFLLKLFVPELGSAKSANVRTRTAAAASMIGIVSNVVLFVMKLVVGILAGSIAITADAVNNIADAASSVITLVGFRLASKPADKEHPYGHQRIEYITGLIVSVMVLVIGVEFFTNSLSAIRETKAADFTLPSLLILVVSIAIKLWQSRFYRTASRAIDSSALEAAASDSRNDALSTSVILLGAAVSHFFSVNTDGILGLLVALYIIKSGIDLVRETSDPLLGTAPSGELVDAIGKRIMSYEGVLGFHDLVVHNYGPDQCFASVHVEMAAEMNILVSHDTIDNIEFDFRKDMGIHMVGHLDPIITSDEELAELRREIEAIVAQTAAELGFALTMHDFRVVRGHTHTNLVFDVVVPCDCPKPDKELCAIIDAHVKMLCEQYNTVITCDRSYLSCTPEEKNK